MCEQVQDLTGIKFHQSALDKAKLTKSYHPPDPMSAMKFTEGDFEHLGPGGKHARQGHVMIICCRVAHMTCCDMSFWHAMSCCLHVML